MLCPSVNQLTVAKWCVKRYNIHVYTSGKNPLSQLSEDVPKGFELAAQSKP